jgi:hypothetical protein
MEKGTASLRTILRWLWPGRVESSFVGRLWLIGYWVATAVVWGGAVFGVAESVKIAAEDIAVGQIETLVVVPARLAGLSLFSVIQQLAVALVYRWGLWLAASERQPIERRRVIAKRATISVVVVVSSFATISGVLKNVDHRREQAAKQELRDRVSAAERYAASPEGRAELEPGRVWFINAETGELFNARTGSSRCFTIEPEGWGDSIAGDMGCLSTANGRFATSADKAQTIADHAAFDSRRELELTRRRLGICRPDLTNGQIAPLTQEQLDGLLARCIADRPAYLGGL